MTAEREDTAYVLEITGTAFLIDEISFGESSDVSATRCQVRSIEGVGISNSRGIGRPRIHLECTLGLSEASPPKG